MNAEKDIEEAIHLAADHWKKFSSSVPPNLNLRDQVTFFAQPFRKALLAQCPDLRVADDQVLLLVLAEGIARSGTVKRDAVERALGIILPPGN
jgi:hypothetical protein